MIGLALSDADRLMLGIALLCKRYADDFPVHTYEATLD